VIEELTPLIANLGFPIVVALYLLIRIETKLAQMTDQVNDVLKAISKLL